MKKNYFTITDISIYNSIVKSNDDVKKLYKEGLFSDTALWDNYKLKNEIPELGASINSRLRNRMSKMSLGIYTVLEKGPESKIKPEDELVLFTGFGEIETTNQIIKSIVIDRHLLVSPTLFHNSVHHTALGYYTIIKKMNNACITVSDGLSTDKAFVDFITERTFDDKKIVIAAGEENSDLFNIDRSSAKNIVPAFIAFNMEKSSEDTGFRCGGEFKNIDDMCESPVFKDADKIFTGKELFKKLKNRNEKNILTEYPLLADNPLGIIFRLSLPFVLEKKGHFLVCEEYNDKILYFEVFIR